MKNVSTRVVVVLAAVLIFVAVCPSAVWTPPAQAGVFRLADANDPNEPEPEMVPMACLDDDPNEPEPEMVPIACLDDDPNEPEPEMVPIACLDDDPNEPEPELT